MNETETVEVGTVKELALAMGIEPVTFADLLCARWGLQIHGVIWDLTPREAPIPNTMFPSAQVADVDTPLERALVETIVAQWEYVGQPFTPDETPVNTGPVIEGTVVQDKPRKGGLVEILNKDKSQTAQKEEK